MKALELTGQQFGHLTVIGPAPKPAGEPRPFWRCRCDCGETLDIRSRSLVSGNTRSCGHIRGQNQIKHGHARWRQKPSPEYRTWTGMIQRCNNPNMQNYARYGGRGIDVCERWQKSFPSFLEDMGLRPSDGHSIDRIDSNGNYEPGNCRWATIKEQNNNRKPPTQPLARAGVKLSKETVLEIRRLFAEGALQKLIAKRFALSKSMVCLIVNRKCWRNV